LVTFAVARPLAFVNVHVCPTGWVCTTTVYVALDVTEVGKVKLLAPVVKSSLGRDTLPLVAMLNPPPFVAA
jgi:hypothetical protein